MKIELIAAGRLRHGPEFELCREYIKRLSWPFTLTEIESKYRDESQAQSDELSQITNRLQPAACVIALDERGKSLPSRQMAQKIEHFQDAGTPLLQFVIGGANGLDETLRQRANLLLSFGAQTWPHMLARAMLLEQIYRCQQILKNHPYHRD
ncbi:MAG: 23S rRNA (pseudouridine(1915)-N(3))-methyltransferase RlmH [Alphaproteobacteria bacterium]|nr:23S rRNA (pseudouridine(1915)-N(3))-methyltransferase RlmH [Alphaproteobacteria bacterium]